ncbi:BT_3044 domain-containing protein [Paraflavitalea speifideaquila]|uniref:BT_3044 domain-containing protein n=1 Tax=Paraflavitalea speifideaquila TaxID=3076558 RepID=UPI0028F0C289|nr:DUF4361 domain-containing protein [Paraflavitalea speifideiaquila]
MITVLNAGGVVTIPKGSNTGYLQVKFKPSSFLGGSWALAYQISSVDKTGYTISTNLKTAIIPIIVKNPYDGVYHAFGHFEHPTVPRDFDIDEMELSTVNANTVNKLIGDLGSASGTINVTVNPDNSVTITAASGNTGATATVAGLPGLVFTIILTILHHGPFI